MNLFLSFSRSTNSFRATDCTRPADNPLFFKDLNVFQSTGENEKPTIRSIALLAR